MQYLKQSTAATITIGPFVDDADGKTAETSLTIAQAGVRLHKAGGVPTQKSDATSATHRENGYYTVPLNTTDTNTLGRLRVAASIAGALPVWEDFTVIPAVVYDALIGGTDMLNVNVAEISDDATAANNLELYCDGTTPQPVNATQVSGSGPAADALELLGLNAKGIDNKILISTDAQNLGGSLSVNTAAISGDSTAADNCELMFDGTGYAGGATPLQVDAKLLSASAPAADALELLALNAKGSDNKLLISANAQDLSASLDVRTKAISADAVNASALAADAITEITNAMKALTFAELTVGAPAATPTLEQAIMLLYMKLRNEETVTGSLLTVKNNAGAVIAKATISDDGITFTKQQLITGA